MRKDYLIYFCLAFYALFIIFFPTPLNNLDLKIERTLATPIYYFRLLNNPLNNPSPLIKPQPSYTIVLVGDSMTERLGPNVSELRSYLKDYYPDKTFDILNYGVGSTSVLSLPDRLDKETDYPDRHQPPITQKPFDLIIIESFGQNPLSQYPLAQGLKKQTEMLDWTVATIRQTHPNSVIMFAATISPNRDRYGEGVVNLDTEKRREWADERTAYIRNHIHYAEQHHIPLANIYQKSLNQQGTGNIDYINTDDFIHPSTSGIYLISKTIADTIFNKRLLPL